MMVRLGDYIKLIGGGTPSKKIEEYWNGNIPWMSVKDLKTDYIYETQDRITQAGVNNSATNIIGPNTIVIATRMAVGKPVMTKIATAINQDLKAIETNDKINTKYLFYKLKSERSYFERISAGATVKGIKISAIEDLKLILPPLDQQKQIAKILDTADAYRQKTKALLEKYDQLTQSLFLEMFGDPITNPNGWEILTFNDVLEIRNGKNQRNIENENGIYPICGSGGIMSYGDDFISEANSVIIGRKGNINKPILMKERYWHVDTAFGLNPIKTILGHDYLFWFCARYNFEQHNKTVTIPSLTKETLMRIKIPIPTIELQNQFSERVQAIEAQKLLAQKELEKAETLFNSLLQRAFKGELTI